MFVWATSVFNSASLFVAFLTFLAAVLYVCDVRRRQARKDLWHEVRPALSTSLFWLDGSSAARCIRGEDVLDEPLQLGMFAPAPDALVHFGTRNTFQTSLNNNRLTLCSLRGAAMAIRIYEKTSGAASKRHKDVYPLRGVFCNGLGPVLLPARPLAKTTLLC